MAAQGYSHIMWVDADAVVVQPRTPLAPLLQLGAALPGSAAASAAGSGGGGDGSAGGASLVGVRPADLTVAEDMNGGGCRLNAGVLLIRVSGWSRSVWREVCRGGAWCRGSWLHLTFFL